MAVVYCILLSYIQVRNAKSVLQPPEPWRRRQFALLIINVFTIIVFVILFCLKRAFNIMKFSRYIVFLLILCAGNAGAQSTGPIIKSHAFYSVITPGNIPVDEEGNPRPVHPDTLVQIYVETKGEGLKWKYAWKNGKTYTVTAEPIDKKRIVVGHTAYNKAGITLNAGEGNKLWLLVLQPAPKEIKSPFKLKAGELIIQGLHKNKKFNHHLKHMIRLYREPSM
jgi:hypothetical protein